MAELKNKRSISGGRNSLATASCNGESFVGDGYPGKKTIAAEKSQLTRGGGRHNCNLAIVKV